MTSDWPSWVASRETRWSVSRRADHGGRIFIVGPDHRRAAGFDDFGEKAELGRKIGIHRAMIVEMVVAQIGEGGCFYRQAFGAILIEAVARRLERCMGDALGGEARHVR